MAFPYSYEQPPMGDPMPGYCADCSVDVWSCLRHITDHPAHRIVPKNERWMITDAWIKTFPHHAEDYYQQIKDFGVWANRSAEEKLRDIAARIRAHAVSPMNWANCSICKIERMDKEI